MSSLLGTLVGFGTGHAAQGRWKETGWLYSAGEALGVAVAVGGTAACLDGVGDDDNDLSESFDKVYCAWLTIRVGGSGFLAVKAVEIIDVWSHPLMHNKRYRRLRERMETDSRSEVAFAPWAAPGPDGSVRFGLAFRY